MVELASVNLSEQNIVEMLKVAIGNTMMAIAAFMALCDWLCPVSQGSDDQEEVCLVGPCCNSYRF